MIQYASLLDVMLQRDYLLKVRADILAMVFVLLTLLGVVSAVVMSTVSITLAGWILSSVDKDSYNSTWSLRRKST